jgi:hypothetical protein
MKFKFCLRQQSPTPLDQRTAVMRVAAVEAGPPSWPVPRLAPGSAGAS